MPSLLDQKPLVCSLATSLLLSKRGGKQLLADDRLDDHFENISEITPGFPRIIRGGFKGN